MFLPYKVDVPMARWPIANFVLIGVTIIISIALFSPLNDWAENAPHSLTVENGHLQLELAPAEGVLNYFLLQPRHFHPLQLVGSVFAHQGILHLLGNMLFLWVFGNAINAKLGHWQYILFYLGVGILEGLVWLAIGPKQPALGASGAIMGVVGAMFILYPVNEISIGYWFFAIYAGVTEISAGWVIALYFILDVYGAVFKQGAGIGYLAHVAGFLAGAGATAALLWWGVLETARGERSFLQVTGLMPDEESSWDDGRPTPPPKVVARPPAAPRKPRDTGPIPLD